MIMSTEKIFPRLLAVAFVSALSFNLASCSSGSGADAGECARMFLENCLSGDMDSARRYCSSELYEEAEAALHNDADSSVLAIYREMIADTEISVSGAENAGEDSVIVSLRMQGQGREYEGRLLAVKRSGEWEITDIL